MVMVVIMMMTFFVTYLVKVVNRVAMIMAIMLMTILVMTWSRWVVGLAGRERPSAVSYNPQVWSTFIINIFRRIKLQQEIGNEKFPNLTRPEKMVEEPRVDQLWVKMT